MLFAIQAQWPFLFPALFLSTWRHCTCHCLHLQHSFLQLCPFKPVKIPDLAQTSLLQGNTDVTRLAWYLLPSSLRFNHIVMINFICWSDWPQDARLNSYCCCVCEINIWIGGHNMSPVWVGTIQSIEGLNKTRGGGRRNSTLSPFPLLELGYLTPSSLFSCYWTETASSHASPGSLACRWQFIRLVSLHSNMSQFLKRNLSHLCLHTHTHILSLSYRYIYVYTHTYIYVNVWLVSDSCKLDLIAQRPYLFCSLLL